MVVKTNNNTNTHCVTVISFQIKKLQAEDNSLCTDDESGIRFSSLGTRYHISSYTFLQKLGETRESQHLWKGEAKLTLDPEMQNS